MSHIVTAEIVRSLLIYCPTTGIFTNRVTRGSRAQIGQVAGSPDLEGYLQISLCGKNYKAHRLAWLYVTGSWPLQLIDHRNTMPADNRWANLRDASPAINSQNIRAPRARNKCGMLGVSFDVRRGKYLSQISVDGKKQNLGRYSTALEAHEAYLSAKRIIHVGNTL